MSETGEDRDYYRAAEAAFIRRRGTPFLLSPKDFALLKQWRALGVPLEAVEHGIDDAFTRREERGATGKINSLAYCRDAVLAAWERQAEASVGRGAGRDESPDVARSLGELSARLAEIAGRRSDLADKSLNGLDLAGLDFSDMDLTGARLNRANLKGAVLKGARLDLAWLIEADLEGADLREASLMQSQLIKARLAGADLSGARVVANFESAHLEGATMTAASMAPDMRNQSMGLMRTVFRSAVLDRADRALYEAKRNGRNRVWVDSASSGG